jgi:hypothetical protein
MMTTEGFSYFSYLTHPAQGWKDKVETADFTLRIHGDPVWSNPNRELPKTFIHPKPHATGGKEFHWHYEDWEPEEPIIVAVPLSIGRPYQDVPDGHDDVSNWQNDAFLAKTSMNIHEDSIIQPSEIASTTASSYLQIDPAKEPSRTEPLGTEPKNAFDADPFASAWITGADQANGIGAKLTATFGTPQTIQAVGIVPGYHIRKNADYYKRPKTIEIVMDGGISMTWELEDRERDLYVLETSLQRYELPEAVTTKSVTLVIKEVFPSKYKTRPAAISEVLLFKAPPMPVEKAPQEDPEPEETSAAKTVKVPEAPEPAAGDGCSCKMAGSEPSHCLAVVLVIALLGFLSRRSWK